MKVVWSSQARGDLRAIRDFISRDSEHYASLQIERLISRIEQTAEMPSKGHPVHEFMESGLREVHEATKDPLQAPKISIPSKASD